VFVLLLIMSGYEKGTSSVDWLKRRVQSSPSCPLFFLAPSYLCFLFFFLSLLSFLSFLDGAPTLSLSLSLSLPRPCHTYSHIASDKDCLKTLHALLFLSPSLSHNLTLIFSFSLKLYNALSQFRPLSLAHTRTHTHLHMNVYCAHTLSHSLVSEIILTNARFSLLYTHSLSPSLTHSHFLLSLRTKHLARETLD